MVVDGADRSRRTLARSPTPAERFGRVGARARDGVDIVVRAHADVGARAGWLAERADCEIRVERCGRGARRTRRDVRDDAQTTRGEPRRGETVEGDVRVDGTRGAIGEQG